MQKLLCDKWPCQSKIWHVGASYPLKPEVKCSFFIHGTADMGELRKMYCNEIYLTKIRR